MLLNASVLVWAPAFRLMEPTLLIQAPELIVIVLPSLTLIAPAFSMFPNGFAVLLRPITSGFVPFAVMVPWLSMKLKLPMVPRENCWPLPRKRLSVPLTPTIRLPGLSERVIFPPPAAVFEIAEKEPCSRVVEARCLLPFAALSAINPASLSTTVTPEERNCRVLPSFT